ncbi:MAG: terminase large subunit [Rhodospirillaceae bacterium]
MTRYARAVVDGTIPAGRYHGLACARHLRDLERAGTPAFPYVLRAALVDRFLAFAREMRHYKGPAAGRPFTLEDHQVFRLGSIFGWVHMSTGRRRFRTSYNEIPRKNGKSFEAAAVALYTTFATGEQGAEGYCIATKRDQAKIVFDAARAMVRMSPKLSQAIVSQVANLHVVASASKLEPLGSDHDSTDGLNPSCIITDELHAHKDRGLLDVMETATGARAEPLHFQITTAGSTLTSPCGDQHQYACGVLDGSIVDETFHAFLAHADPGDDWLDPQTWRKANPNFGVSVLPEDLEALALKARSMPAAVNTFKQKRLNLWVNTDAPWLSMDGWLLGQSARPWADWTRDLVGRRCMVGIDLASRLDLCAVVALFPPESDAERWRAMVWAWTPAATILERERRDKAPYRAWADLGVLRTSPGTSIDHALARRVIVEEIRAMAEIDRIGFDPWHADQVARALVEEDGFSADQVLEVSQTYAGMSAGCLALEGEILRGAVDANGHPVLTWAVGNAVVQSDAKGNIYPVKKRSRGRIDPLMALAIAWALERRFAGEPGSVYEGRGVIEVSL